MTPPSNPELSKALASFKAFARALHPLSDEQFGRLDELATLQRFAPGQVVSQPGTTPTQFGIVAQGLLISTRTTPEGKEVVRQIWPEATLWGHYIDFLSKSVSESAIVAVEPSLLLTFSFAPFNRLGEGDLDWCMWIRRVTERLLLEWEQRCMDLHSLEASERYAMFEKRFAPLLPRLKKQIVASYLGIRPESLSRLIAKSADKAGKA